jgi:hypothetical protein
MDSLKSDFTAIIRDNNGISILKAKIIDEHYLWFQMYNKTKNVLLPCFKIRADYGLLKFCKPTKREKEMEERWSKTDSVNRESLINYYNHFKLHYLISKMR